jgi:hypothetical protein
MNIQQFSSTAEAKKEHWFSRRHQTSDAHLTVKAAREERRAKQRARVNVVRTPSQQLAELDRRLGVGVGATKERARLAARCVAQQKGGK